MSGLSATRQAHYHETRQRDGLEKTAAGGLNPREEPQRSRAREIATQPRNRITGGKMIVPSLTDRDQRGQRITDYWQSQRGKPRGRKSGQLKRQRQDKAPRFARCSEAAA